MAKFNKSIKSPSVRAEALASHKDAILNHEGALAFKMDDYTDLYVRVATCLVGEKKYYESAEKADQELIASIRRVLAVDPEFVLQLALYARSVLNLRSVPMLLMAEYANSPHAEVVGASKYVAATIQRADELTELTALQFKINKQTGRKTLLPMTLKRGMARAFEKFDEYRLAKYNKPGDVRLRDVYFLVRPSPANAERVKVYDGLVADTMKTPETWEVMRSTGKMTWSDVVNKVFHKNGRTNNYMALLRNLRNIMQDPSVTNADMGLVCRMLADEKAVQYARQFPFRYLAAYREVEQMFHPMQGQVLDALEQAAEYSLSNLPRLSGVTAIAVDTSGSMEAVISEKSTIRRYEVGLMLGSIAHKFCDQDYTGIFGTTYQPVSLPKYTSGILASAGKMRSYIGKAGHATNGYEVIKYLNKNDLHVDRIFVFSDMQMWDSARPRYGGALGDHFGSLFLDYQRRHKGTRLYCFDLAGHASLMVPQESPGVAVIGGWNERIFDFVDAFEKTGAQGGVIEKIRAQRP